jgi:hypothetical protein
MRMETPPAKAITTSKGGPALTPVSQPAMYTARQSEVNTIAGRENNLNSPRFEVSV